MRVEHREGDHERGDQATRDHQCEWRIGALGEPGERERTDRHRPPGQQIDAHHPPGQPRLGVGHQQGVVERRKRREQESDHDEQRHGDGERPRHREEDQGDAKRNRQADLNRRGLAQARHRRHDHRAGQRPGAGRSQEQTQAFGARCEDTFGNHWHQRLVRLAEHYDDQVHRDQCHDRWIGTHVAQPLEEMCSATGAAARDGSPRQTRPRQPEQHPQRQNVHARHRQEGATNADPRDRHEHARQGGTRHPAEVLTGIVQCRRVGQLWPSDQLGDIRLARRHIECERRALDESAGNDVPDLEMAGQAEHRERCCRQTKRRLTADQHEPAR